MRLQSIKYSEHVGGLQEWVLDGLALESKNLIVGKNATGKTRSLNVIGALARFLAGLQGPPLSSTYDCLFTHKGQKYQYALVAEEQQVKVERLLVDGELKLERGEGGVGHIWAQEIDGGTQVKFQTPTTEFAAVARRDSIQHAFLEPLFEWATSLRHYYFGTSLGKDTLAIRLLRERVVVDERDPNALVGLFRQARDEFGEKFTSSLVDDLAAVDYTVKSVDIGSPVSVRFSGTPGEVVSLLVQEADLPGLTDQHSMSQGMFRVLALLVHLNYFELKWAGACVLIDDIGEGLDFDRSCRLVNLLRRKADKSDIQLVMSTNDRFIMNEVPLEEWSVLQRKNNHVAVRNYENSRALFDEFKFTGLSNFSFLELDVIHEPQQTRE